MRIPSTASPEIQQAFREVFAALDPLTVGPLVDFRRRRVINAGDAVDAQDYVTLAQLRSLVTGPLASISASASGGTALRYGAHDTKVATAPTPDGAIFVETDRGHALYQAQNVSGSPAWVWIGGGPYRDVIADITTGLTANDEGYLFYASNFDRVYRWSGSAWADAPGQPMRGQISYFSDDALPSPSTAWQLMDGSTVDISRDDGTVDSITVDDLTSDQRFIRSTATTTGVTGGNAAGHTHSVTIASGTTGANSDNQIVQSGVGVSVAADPHDHGNNAGQTVTSGIPSGVGGDDGNPVYVKLRPYMRL